MGRRKKAIIEDDGDSSEGERPGAADDGMEGMDADRREEAAMFANPYGRHKRRGKEDGIYGVFAESDDEEDDRRGSVKGGRKQGGGNRYTTGVQFVSGRTGTEQQGDDDDDDSDDEGHDGVGEGEGGNGGVEPMDVDDRQVVDDKEEEEEEEMDERPSFGRPAFGLGFDDQTEDDAPESTGLGFSSGNTRPGLGASTFETASPRAQTGGLGYTPSARSTLVPQSTTMPDVPTSFGRSKSKPGRNVREKQSSKSGSRDPVDEAIGKFDTKGAASRMMEKMGWKKGQGLGKDRAGISTHIDVKLRPNRAGLGMVDERTDSHKREQAAKATEESNEDLPPTPPVEVRTGQWKQSSKKKRQKPAFKSAQELIAEQAQAPISTASSTRATKILDMTGRNVRELAHVSEAATSSAAFDVTAARLPELRHNVRLIADLAQQDLLHVGRQMRIEKQRQAQLRQQEATVSARVTIEQTSLSRLREVQQIAKQCQRASQEVSRSFADTSLDALTSAFAEPFHKLQTQYFPEYQEYRLDELVVAALAPVMKRVLMTWEPLTNPTFGADVFGQWQKLLMIPLGVSKEPAEGENRMMTPYEAMMYNVWLPKVRQAVNNEWDPRHPDAVISLIEAWHVTSVRPTLLRPGKSKSSREPEDSGLLPSWLYHNILEQLILPKLTRQVADWNPGQDPIPINTWLHPWLPHLHDRMEGIFTTIRHKLNVSWRERQWLPSDPSALATLTPWLEVFKQSDLEALIIKAVLPKLVESLQKDFTVNPAAQDIVPLQHILAWAPLVPTHLFVHLFETEFFPKWHSVLWAWLSSPGASEEEIALWYQTWKTRVFPPDFVKQPGIATQFRAGLDMMNRSIAMGGARGPMPPPPPPVATTSDTAAAGGHVGGTGARRPGGLAAGGITAMSAADTFKDYVERAASARDMLFAPANRLHPTSGRALFRLAPAAKAAAGTGGVVGYIDEGVLFVEDADVGWKPVGVDEALDLAEKKKGRR